MIGKITLRIGDKIVVRNHNNPDRMQYNLSIQPCPKGYRKGIIMSDQIFGLRESDLNDENAVKHAFNKARRLANVHPIMRPHLLRLKAAMRSGNLTLSLFRPFAPRSYEMDGSGKIIGSHDIPPCTKRNEWGGEV